MYFPFFSIEVKCGTSGLVVADRQSGHTMGVSVQSIVSIYRLAGKELELHSRPIAFSISHDRRTARLTGWGAIIDGDFYTVKPFPIHSFDVTALKGRELWTPRKFTIGVYEYGLVLLDKLKTIIEELPSDLNLDKVQPLKLGLNTGLELRPPNRYVLWQKLDAHKTSGGENPHSQQSSINSEESHHLHQIK